MRVADIGRALWATAQWPLKQELNPHDGTTSTTTFLPFSIAEEWSVLGPFQIGTREVTWGADPLERYGGFHTLHVDDGAQFPSSLAFNGSVTWAQRQADVTELPLQEFSATLDVAFPDVDWALLQKVYGWSALQWQAWARGKLIVTSEEPVLLWMHLKQVLEFWIDDKHYFGGDMYGFNRAPTTLSLSPGEHTIELRVVRDIRAMGGITDNPNVEINVHLSATHGALRRSTDVLLPDRLNNELGPTTSTFASVVLRNDDDNNIYIDSLQATHDICNAELVQPVPIKLVPGQSRPIAFQLSCIPGTSATSSIKLFFYYHSDKSPDRQRMLFAWGLPRRPQPQTEPHLLTYPHPSGVVSYAIIKPPLVNACPSNSTLPVLLVLHGAGVDPDDDSAKHSLDDLPPLCAWTLLPSGVTSWSGDDWHDWGWADVQAAIHSIPSWIEQVEWEGPGVDVNRWLVTGHSNGGQGTWHALTHFPDQIIGAAPISGYSSIEAYVPYSWWHVSDPKAMSIIHAGLSSHQNELLLENAANIPLLIQHGSADDNVPAYHSRLMHARLQELGIPHALTEIQDQPHWWDGVMATPALTDFFTEHLSSCRGDNRRHRRQNFTLVSSNPGNTGSKAGFRILELSAPAQVGRLSFMISEEGACYVRTQSIKSFAVSKEAAQSCVTLLVDKSTVPTDGRLHAIKDQSGRWSTEAIGSKECPRTPAQQGGLEAILRSQGTFQVVQHANDLDHIALQIANNLCQYFGADVAIADDYSQAVQMPGNIISVVIGDGLPESLISCKQKCSFKVEREQITLTTQHGVDHTYTKADHDLAAAIFLRHLPDDRLELVVWASEHEHVALAARLVPTLTGSGHPDFVVASTSMSYGGIQGVLAMGFLDGDWCAAPSSFFIDE